MDKERLKKLQRLFLLFFGVTGLILGVVLVRLGDPKYAGAEMAPGQTPISPPPLPSAERVTLTIALVSTLITAVGFISTTALAWRKELRESRSAALEQERRQLELEKLRRDLESARVAAEQK